MENNNIKIKIELNIENEEGRELLQALIALQDKEVNQSESTQVFTEVTLADSENDEICEHVPMLLKYIVNEADGEVHEVTETICEHCDEILEPHCCFTATKCEVHYDDSDSSGGVIEHSFFCLVCGTEVTTEMEDFWGDMAEDEDWRREER